MITLLATGLALALIVLGAAMIALGLDGRQITRLEHALAVERVTAQERTAERDEARRSLREALETQRDAYIRLRPGDVVRPLGDEFTQIVERNKWSKGGPS